MFNVMYIYFGRTCKANAEPLNEAESLELEAGMKEYSGGVSAVWRETVEGVRV